MKILFTGSSSFTGYWFIKELVGAGHEVIAVLRRPIEEYTGTRRVRVEEVAKLAEVVFCSFGDADFIDCLRKQDDVDQLCHHAADVTDYKSSDFDVVRAVENNTKQLAQVLDVLQEKGMERIILTGSVFEQREGSGSDLDQAFSPYGLSKGVTADIFQYHTTARNMRFGKFVIPNPFGPFEEKRFTSFLVSEWFAGKAPHVATPAYVRDNIHVSLLAKAYVDFVEAFLLEKCHPSGYAESQGAFTERFAREMRCRLDLPCDFTCAKQESFPEPKVRINTDEVSCSHPDWDEKRAWDELAEYYRDNL